jgi:5'-deoxynucleotidase
MRILKDKIWNGDKIIMNYNFFALISRMKYIERWALMRNTRPENLCEHSMEVAMIAHALCIIGNVRYGKNLDANKAALIGLYHDASEIITGDMPTPVKYFNADLKHAYKEVEAIADDKLLEKLPDDLRPSFEQIFKPEDNEDEKYMRRLVKAADKLSALIKCIGEINAGNTEFRTAKESTGKSIRSMYQELPEVLDFVNEFLSSYGSTLDELT